MSAEIRLLEPPGPVAARFLTSRAYLCAIVGPVGSGKTMACASKVLRAAMLQKGRRDARGIVVRHAKIIVVGKTYPIIDANLLPSWFNVVPEEVGVFNWSAPRSHAFKITLRSDAEGNALDYVEVTVEFRAIGDKTVEAALRGSEATVAWLYEADTLPGTVIEYLGGRVGRFSKMDPATIVDPQIFMDLNAPDVDNWWYALFIDRVIDPEVEKAITATLNEQPLIEHFIQPEALDAKGNLNPHAENLKNLIPGYYQRQWALAKSQNYRDRMLRNRFVPVQHGQPVYPEFDYKDHVAESAIPADRARKLIVGLDGGLTPAAAICQRTSLGDLRVLGELVVFAEADETLGKVGATRFGQALRAYLAERFPHHYSPPAPGVHARQGRAQIGHNGPPSSIDPDDDDLRADARIEFWADPATKDGTDKSGNEQSWIEIVAAQLGHRVRPARTNRVHLRLEVVRLPMMRRGGFLIAPQCKTLRKGFLSGYHYERIAKGDGTGRFASEPAKNMFSHVQDALQYAALADGAAVNEILGKDRTRARRRGARVDYGGSYFAGGQ